MPHPPKILKRLDLIESISHGGRHLMSQHVETSIKTENVPLKQRVLEAMQSAHERVNQELDIEGKLQGHSKSRGLLESFVEVFKETQSAYKIERKIETKNIFFGLEKRLQIKCETNRGIIRFLVVDKGDSLVVTMTSSINDSKQNLKEVELAMKRNYHRVKHIQLDNVRLVGLNLMLSFIVESKQGLLDDLLLLMSPFV